LTNKIVTKKLATKKPAKPPAATAAPPSLARRPAGYPEWLADVKDRVRVAQQRASLSVNRELLRLYWGIGRDILDRQVAGTWGEGIVDQVAADLRAEFPSMKGFSRSNLMYMRAFAEAWPDPAFVQQPVGQIPWGHNLVLLTKLKDKNARIAYATSVLKHGWSRAVLVHHIEARTEVRVSSTTMFGIPHLPSRGFTYRCLLCGLAVFGVVSVACTEATRISAPLDARMDLIGNTDRQDALIFAADSNDSGPNPCGNGLQDPGEECDDGNARDGDGCRNCSLELGSICPHFGQPCMKIYACGNGYLSSDEACDDGNTVSGDGCSGDCHQVEPGWQCRVTAKTSNQK
jgi:cysteine-rich repeat protein